MRYTEPGMSRCRCVCRPGRSFCNALVNLFSDIMSIAGTYLRGGDKGLPSPFTFSRSKQVAPLPFHFFGTCKKLKCKGKKLPVKLKNMYKIVWEVSCFHFFPFCSFLGYTRFLDESPPPPHTHTQTSINDYASLY